MQKGFAPIIIILAIVVIAGLIGGAVYLKQNKPTRTLPSTPSPTIVSRSDQNRTPSGSKETVNWNVYKDNLIGIEFKYPPYIQKIHELDVPYREGDLCYPHGCNLLIISPENKKQLTTCAMLREKESKQDYLKKCSRDTTYDNWNLKIEELVQSPSTSLEDYVSTSIASRSGCRLDRDTKSLTIGGKAAIKIQCAGIGNSLTQEIFIPKNATTILKLINFNEDPLKTNTILDQILSTFRFD